MLVEGFEDDKGIVFGITPTPEIRAKTSCLHIEMSAPHDLPSKATNLIPRALTVELLVELGPYVGYTPQVRREPLKAITRHSIV